MASSVPREAATPTASQVPVATPPTSFVTPRLLQRTSPANFFAMVELSQHAPLGWLLVRATKAHRRWVAAALEELGLHVGQEFLLAQLCQQEGMRPTALARALAIELPTVHKTLSRLEAAGFVERRSDPSDARASLIHLTPQGRETCARIRAIWEDADRRLRAALPVADAARLEELLTTLTEHLDRS